LLSFIPNFSLPSNLITNQLNNTNLYNKYSTNESDSSNRFLGIKRKNDNNIYNNMFNKYLDYNLTNEVNDISNNANKSNNNNININNNNINNISIQKQSGTKKITCKCRNSKCLKDYCDCFQAGVFCTDCYCCDCKNVPENIQNINKIKKIKNNANTNNNTNNSTTGFVFCKCTNSQCQKKYCECFKANVKCTSECRCIKCLNCDNISCKTNNATYFNPNVNANSCTTNANINTATIISQRLLYKPITTTNSVTKSNKNEFKIDTVANVHIFEDNKNKC